MAKKILDYYISDQDKNNSDSKKKDFQPKKVKVIIPDKSILLCQTILEKIELSKPKLVHDSYPKNIEIVKSSIAILSECSNLLLKHKKDMKSQHIRDCRTAIKNMYKIHMEIREQLESGKK
ncbi:MAG: hypothetical protein ACYDA4_01560 [Ignavibacteriaceae bacterium]